MGNSKDMSLCQIEMDLGSRKCLSVYLSKHLTWQLLPLKTSKSHTQHYLHHLFPASTITCFALWTNALTSLTVWTCLDNSPWFSWTVCRTVCSRRELQASSFLCPASSKSFPPPPPHCQHVSDLGKGRSKQSCKLFTVANFELVLRWPCVVDRTLNSNY